MQSVGLFLFFKFPPQQLWYLTSPGLSAWGSVKRREKLPGGAEQRAKPREKILAVPKQKWNSRLVFHAGFAASREGPGAAVCSEAS